MATSFQKRPRGKVLQIPGAKPSLYNNQLLVSTGIPTLDQLVGGGIAVGTVFLIEEDTYGNYGRLMLKYFCAEAVMTGHSLMLTSADINPEQLLSDLPAPIIDDPAGKQQIPDMENAPDADDDNMQIAWRYRHLPKFQSSPTGIKFGHYYDLTKTMPEDLVKTISITNINGITLGSDFSDSITTVGNRKYSELLQKIKHQVDAGGFSTSASSEKRNVLRIAVHSLGSPLWGENGGLTSSDGYDPSLPRFLLGLRAILRTAFAVCVITIPAHLFCDKVFVKRVENLCDTVVHVDSFVGSDKEKNPAYKEYHGIFNIRKLPRLNTLVCHMPESLDLAFKLRRKKFTIDKLHLPPDLSETANRSQEDPMPQLKQSTACVASTGKNKLDF